MNGQIITELRNVGTFNATQINEVRQNGAPSIGTDGFAPPSLLSLFSISQTLLHGGAANSLDEVLSNVVHRSAGTGTDLLQDTAKRAQLIKFLLSIDASTPPITPNVAGKLSVTSAAWDIGPKLAPDSIASGYGSNLATQAGVPPATPAAVTFNGTTVSVQDSAGVLRLGQLFAASPGQVNFVVPANTTTGPAVITVTSGSGALSTTTADIAQLAPAVFAMPGGSVAAAVALKATSAGVQTQLPVFQCSATPVCTATPIDLGAEGDTVVLSFFGTGLRKNSGLSNVKVSIGGAEAPVLFAGAQGQFPVWIR